MGGGAWPFLVGGVICLVYSDNERDSGLLNLTPSVSCDCGELLKGTVGVPAEGRGAITGL